ncbi:uncharacterized protein LOC143082289 [Mytilus galloprovincialis]|uniref:uncharacterized protein LOC143082289 n=1 Tax=Mytilus galloprovincialis TaxID=29158 RepID=UPI003F7C184E
MDLITLFLVFILCFVDFTTPNRNDDMWEALSLRFGVWKELPRTSHEAERKGYTRVNDICKTNQYHGFLYRRLGDTKDIPIYDLNGWIAGIQAMIPAYMKGYNSLNESIALPPYDIMPPLIYGRDPHEPGRTFYTITAYFKHPQLVCNPIAKHHIQTGKGLYIQTGLDPIVNHMSIPLESKQLGPMWVQGTCVPRMGTHYFYNLSRSLPCEKIYPVFLMYDSEGKLGAFGWSFQGFALDSSQSDLSWFKLRPETYQFTFDTSKLPPCMFNENFQVFGIHIWLKDPNSDTMLCKIIQRPQQRPTSTRKPDKITYKTGYRDNHIINADRNTDNVSSRNTLHYTLIVLIILSCYHILQL